MGDDRAAPRLSIVIPAFDEEQRLGATLARVGAYLAAQPYTAEVIVVDDGSRDRTAAVAAAALGAIPDGRLVTGRANRGKGYSVREGLLLARGALVLFSDADLSTPIEDAAKLIAAIEAGADVAIGSRALPGSEIRVRQAPLRELMGKTFNLFVRALALGGIPDTQCGFKLLRRAAVQDVVPRMTIDGFGFDVELLLLCRRRGWSIAQVPVVWCDARGSKVHLAGSSLGMLRDLWRTRRNR